MIFFYIFYIFYIYIFLLHNTDEISSVFKYDKHDAGRSTWRRTRTDAFSLEHMLDAGCWCCCSSSVHCHFKNIRLAQKFSKVRYS